MISEAEQKILLNAEKIRQNQEENIQFEKKLHKLIEGDQSLASKPLQIGKTPNALVICGAEAKLNLTIKKSVIDKCMRPELRDENGMFLGKNGHGLNEQQLVRALNNIKIPVMIFEGSRPNTLVVVTENKDFQDREIVVAVELNKKENFCEVNRVNSVYGRSNFADYFERQITNGKLLAVNIEKVDKLLHSIEKYYLKENTIINFDNSIAYSTENVTYNYIKKLENYSNKPTSEVEKICRDLKENGFQPTKTLVGNMEKLNKLAGKENSIKDVHSMYSSMKNPEIQNVVNEIAKECRAQELGKHLPLPER